MEILIAALVLAVGLVAAAALLTRRSPGLVPGGNAAKGPAPAPPPPSPSAALAPPPGTPVSTEDGKSAERRADLLRLEERLRAREEAVESRLAELGVRERKLVATSDELVLAREHHIRALERASGMSASEAKHHLLKELEEQIRHDSARLVRQIEEETKRDADRRVRNILAVVMQRLAAGHAAETTVSVVQLPADDIRAASSAARAATSAPSSTSPASTSSSTTRRTR